MNWWNTTGPKQSPFPKASFELIDVSASSRTRHRRHRLRACSVLAAGIVSGSSAHIRQHILNSSVSFLCYCFSPGSGHHRYRFLRALSCPWAIQCLSSNQSVLQNTWHHIMFSLCLKNLPVVFPVTWWINPKILLYPTRPYQMLALLLPPLNLPISVFTGSRMFSPPLSLLVAHSFLNPTHHDIPRSLLSTQPFCSYYPASFSS